jgi:hypothetical protein
MHDRQCGYRWGEDDAGPSENGALVRLGLGDRRRLDDEDPVGLQSLAGLPQMVGTRLAGIRGLTWIDVVWGAGGRVTTGAPRRAPVLGLSAQSVVGMVKSKNRGGSGSLRASRPGTPEGGPSRKVAPEYLRAAEVATSVPAQVAGLACVRCTFARWR